MQFFAFLLALGFPDAPRRGEPPSDHLLRHFHPLHLSFASNLARLRRLSLLDSIDLQSINQFWIQFSVYSEFLHWNPRTLRSLPYPGRNRVLRLFGYNRARNCQAPFPSIRNASSSDAIFSRRSRAVLGGALVSILPRGTTICHWRTGDSDDQGEAAPGRTKPTVLNNNNAAERVWHRVRWKVSKSKVRLILWNQITEKEKPWSLKQKYKDLEVAQAT